MQRRSTERPNTRQAGLHPPDGVPPLKTSRTNQDISHHCLRSKVHRTIKYPKGNKYSSAHPRLTKYATTAATAVPAQTGLRKACYVNQTGYQNARQVSYGDPT